MAQLHGGNGENYLVTSHIKIRYKARQDVKQLLKGAGGVWYMKDEQWCKDHEFQVQNYPGAHVDNRQGLESVKMACLLNLIVGDIKTRSKVQRHRRPYNDDSGTNKKKQMLKNDANEDVRSTTQETEVERLGMN